jgi:hypothetical protein
MKTSFHKFMASNAVKKVNLSLLDDVKARIDESKIRIKDLKAAEKAVLDLIENANKFQEKLQDEYGFANSLSVVVENALARAEKSAKELGLDPNSITEIKQLKSIEQELLNAIISADETRSKYNG